MFVIYSINELILVAISGFYSINTVLQFQIEFDTYLIII